MVPRNMDEWMNKDIERVRVPLSLHLPLWCKISTHRCSSNVIGQSEVNAFCYIRTYASTCMYVYIYIYNYIIFVIVEPNFLLPPHSKINMG